MSTKLLTDVAGIFAELGVSFGQAEAIAEILVEANLLDNDIVDMWVDLASNAPQCGECGC